MGIILSKDAFVDLHVHTKISDGTYTPEEVVQLAAQEGIQVLAITDHDEVAGIKRAKKEAKNHSIKIISGIECSTTFEHGTRHILGYNINPDDIRLQKYIKTQKIAREEKIKKILNNLDALGMKISFEDVQKYAEIGVMGRPHIAQALKEKGYVSTIAEAFDLYIGKDKPAYASGRVTTPEEVIKVIRAAGGIPVLAHPFQMKFSSYEEMESEMERLVAMGIKGIEIIYPEHTTEQTYKLIVFAATHKLHVTAGSDFHGQNKQNRLGYCFAKEGKLTIRCIGGLGKTFI